MAFMTHPKHGATHTSDVEDHEKLGWKVSTYEEWLGKKLKKPEAVAAVQLEESPQPEAPRRGRPRKE